MNSIRQVRQVLKRHEKQLLKCLYPETSGVWGWNNPEDLKKTLELINLILNQISLDFWPMDQTEKKVIECGKWSLWLNFYEDSLFADFIYSGDDHTAWVIFDKSTNKWINYDIGGS